jgi:isochorismate synthase
MWSAREVESSWSSGLSLECRLEGLIASAFRAYGKSDRTLCMSFKAPLSPAERLLALPGYENKVLWSPSPEDEHSGVGAAYVLFATGESRFAQIKDAAKRLFQELVVVGLDGDPAPDPKLLGSFAFQPARVHSTVWRGFGDAQFVLPRIAYTRRAQRAWLTLSASEHELSSVEGRARIAREAHEALQALCREDNCAPPELSELMEIDEAEDIWSALVTGIRGEIAAGRLEKAVAARCIVLRGAHLPSPARVLQRLRREARNCTRFALSVGNRTFLGASPERIVKRVGPRVWTEALAGSAQGNDPTHGESLFLSQKNLVEHAIVAREIRSLLAPLYESLSVDGPALHRLPHVLHLRTRFEGILKEPQHVLDLVARLHPTSAVGGAPRAAALAWLAEHELTERGLYAGPFGAFDRCGNGEFVVAIRSGLLAADEAYLFAGAGIVKGSDVESELCETRWKLRGLMAAIGVA